MIHRTFASSPIDGTSIHLKVKEGHRILTARILWHLGFRVKTHLPKEPALFEAPVNWIKVDNWINVKDVIAFLTTSAVAENSLHFYGACRGITT